MNTGNNSIFAIIGIFAEKDKGRNEQNRELLVQ